MNPGKRCRRGSAPGVRKALWVSRGALAAIEAEQRERGWTDRETAAALGIARAHWTAARIGARNLPFVAVCRAYALGIPPAVLLAEK